MEGKIAVQVLERFHTDIWFMEFRIRVDKRRLIEIACCVESNHSNVDLFFLTITDGRRLAEKGFDFDTSTRGPIFDVVHVDSACDTSSLALELADSGTRLVEHESRLV